MSSYDESIPWVVIQLSGQPYAITTGAVRELVAHKELTPMPGAPPHIRGLLNLRSTVMPVVDLRVCMGLKSARQETDEFCAMMDAREADHVRWVEELTASVREKRPFKLTTDPTACAFGKWYGAFRSDRHAVTTVLQRFDEPHRAVHAAGAEVERLKSRGDYEEAERVVKRVRDGELVTMKQLFGKLRELMREESGRETLVVLQLPDNMLAASFDTAMSVERLNQVEPLPSGSGSHDGLVTHLARRGANPRPVMLIETDRLSLLARKVSEFRANGAIRPQTRANV